MDDGPLDLMTVREDALRLRAEAAEERVRQFEELLHEIRATVVGVHAASRILLRHEATVSIDMMKRLEEMVGSELARLGRLLDPQFAAVATEVSLDDLVTPLVVAQRAQGHRVDWERSGGRVHVHADAIAEAVHILLANAVNHGTAEGLSVTVTQTRDLVELRVSDTGPGVPPELRTTLFERGVHGDDAAGEGLGLHLARRLVCAQGGRLWLEQNGSAGATFVITLPASGVR